MGDFIGGVIDVIVGIISTIYAWLNVFLPGPILPVVLGGLAFAGVMWFLFSRR